MDLPARGFRAFSSQTFRVVVCMCVWGGGGARVQQYIPTQPCHSRRTSKHRVASPHHSQLGKHRVDPCRRVHIIPACGAHRTPRALPVWSRARVHWLPATPAVSHIPGPLDAAAGITARTRGGSAATPVAVPIVPADRRAQTQGGLPAVGLRLCLRLHRLPRQICGRPPRDSDRDVHLAKWTGPVGHGWHSPSLDRLCLPSVVGRGPRRLTQPVRALRTPVVHVFVDPVPPPAHVATLGVGQHRDRVAFALVVAIGVSGGLRVPANRRHVARRPGALR